MMLRPLLVSLAGLAALTACSSAPAVPSPTAAPASPTAAPTASGTVMPSNTASGPAPAAGLDVSAWPRADFASPSGRLWCGVRADHALCHFPRGYQGTIPSGNQVCPGEGLDVTGVSVSASGPAYFCSGDPSAYPVVGSAEVAWHRTTGYPTVAYDGLELAVLPYGQALRHGDYLCSSAENGVTCTSRASGRGFRIALAGVVFS